MSTEGPTPPAARRPGRPPAGREPAPAPAPAPRGGGGAGDQQTLLGALLIGVAVILGLVLLVKGFGDDGSATTDQADAPVTSLAEEDLNAPPSFDASDTSVPAATLRPPSEVTVVVANAAGVSGAATKVGDALESAGYTVIDTTNAPSTSPDLVFYTGDLQAEAEALAASLGLDASSVEAMPEQPPLDTQDADVLVMVGPDLASEELPLGGASGDGASTDSGSAADGSTTSTTSP